VVEGALENQICKGHKEVLKAANESSSLVFCITQLLTHTQQTGKKERGRKQKKSQKRKVTTTTTTLKTSSDLQLLTPAHQLLTKLLLVHTTNKG
jgi:hypothetical protein